jgi:hypothetical protein
MPDSEGVFRDDVPIADAVEQQRPTSDSLSDDDEPGQYEGDVPLEAAASDWQEQRETVVIDPELDEPEQPDEP